MNVSLKKLLLIYEVRVIKVRREREYSRQRHNICKGPVPGRSTVSQGTEMKAVWLQHREHEREE